MMAIERISWQSDYSFARLSWKVISFVGSILDIVNLRLSEILSYIPYAFFIFQRWAWTEIKSTFVGLHSLFFFFCKYIDSEVERCRLTVSASPLIASFHPLPLTPMWFLHAITCTGKNEWLVGKWLVS